jgi:hypothetical protein
MKNGGKPLNKKSPLRELFVDQTLGMVARKIDV